MILHFALFRYLLFTTHIFSWKYRLEKKARCGEFVEKILVTRKTTFGLSWKSNVLWETIWKPYIFNLTIKMVAQIIYRFIPMWIPRQIFAGWAKSSFTCSIFHSNRSEKQNARNVSYLFYLSQIVYNTFHVSL